MKKEMSFIDFDLSYNVERVFGKRAFIAGVIEDSEYFRILDKQAQSAGARSCFAFDPLHRYPLDSYASQRFYLFKSIREATLFKQVVSRRNLLCLITKVEPVDFSKTMVDKGRLSRKECEYLGAQRMRAEMGDSTF